MVLPPGRKGHDRSGLKQFGVGHLERSVGGVIDQVASLIVPINLRQIILGLVQCHLCSWTGHKAWAYFDLEPCPKFIYDLGSPWAYCATTLKAEKFF